MSKVYDSIARGLKESINDARKAEKLPRDGSVTLEELMHEMGVTQDDLDKIPDSDVEFDNDDD